MATLISLGIKGKDGKYTNVTVRLGDELDEYGNNVSAWIEQTKEQRDAKEKRNYIGNGKVVWTDGKVISAKELKDGDGDADVDGFAF